MIGTIDNKLAADFARETLKSYDIPAVIISRSGFFGDVGLTLNPFHNSGTVASFEVRVPTSHIEEAVSVVKMIGGDGWHPQEN